MPCSLSNCPMYRRYCRLIMFATLAIRQNYNVNNGKYCVYHFSTPCNPHRLIASAQSATLCWQRHCVQTCSPIRRRYYFMHSRPVCMTYTPSTPLASILKFHEHFCTHTHTYEHKLKDLVLCFFIQSSHSRVLVASCEDSAVFAFSFCCCYFCVRLLLCCDCHAVALCGFEILKFQNAFTCLKFQSFKVRCCLHTTSTKCAPKSILHFTRHCDRDQWAFHVLKSDAKVNWSIWEIGAERKNNLCGS